MSTVYRATQESIGREVAIKVLLSSLIEQDKTFLERFYREVRVAAKLQHPRILPIYDFGVQEGQPYIVMAYLRGGTLSDRIKQGPMSLSETLTILSQIAEALDYAHQQEIIHRDVKPSNIMLDVQGNGYLADFGLAKVNDATNQLTGSQLVGTPDYMAPDFSQGDSVSSAVDIYALGVTIFQMLTGHVPFRGASQMGVLMAHMSQPVPDVRASRPDLPETVQQVIATAMAKKPGERYPSAGTLCEALKTASKQAQHAPHALLFINVQRQVIFVNGQLLQLLGRSEVEARQLVGRPLEQVLGIDVEAAKHLLQDAVKIGRIYSRALTLRGADGLPVEAYCTVEVTYNEKGECIGADLSLRQAAPIKEESLAGAPFAQDYDTGQRRFLQLYVTSQLEALRTLLVRVGGPRLGKTLENIVTETSQRNDWPIRFVDGRLEGAAPSTEPTVYHALLVKAIHYGVNVIGAGIVEKQLKAAEDQMGPKAVEIASRMGLREIIRQHHK
jgi:serine/threonine-protein kinase